MAMPTAPPRSPRPQPLTDSQVCALLSATLSPPPRDAPSPHDALCAAELSPGFIPALFRIATNPAHTINLVAAVYLKNLVRREWQHTCAPSPDSSASSPRRPRVHSSLPPDDKAALRVALVPTLAVVEPKVRAQLAETLKRVISADFPVRFPELLPVIMHALHSSDPRALEAGLIALRALAKVYEFKGAALASRVHPTADSEEELAEPPRQYHFSPHHASAAPNPSTAASPPIDFQFLHDHPRAALSVIVNETFPRLLEIMKGLEATIDAQQRRQRDRPNANTSTMLQPSPSPPPPPPPRIEGDKPFEMQRTICKIFWSFTQYDLPSLLIRDLGGVFSHWMAAFLTAMRRPVMPLVNPDGERVQDDDLRRMPQWKVKQWIGHIVYRLFQRYSNPSRLNPILLRNFDLETLTHFGDFFRKNFAAHFTEAMLEILSWDLQYTSPRVANLALLYLESAVTPNITYRIIKPRLADLITKVIFSYLCISDSDLAQWSDDPVEYVRKTYDVLEDFNTPRAAACSLLLVLSKHRGSVVVAPLLEFLMRILDGYVDCRKRLAESMGNDQQARQQMHSLARQKDGALLAIGTIRETLMSNSQNSQYLDALLNSHVLGEFDSDVPFLRARACWLYGQLTASESVSIDIVMPGLKGVQKCLHDKEFPVRVRAAVDIRHFVQNPVAAEQIAPTLGDLLTLLFTLLDDIDNTDIVATIDQVVVGFSDEVAPYAAPLCARLVETFSRAAAAGQGDDEAGFAAAQCIQALESIVTSVALCAVPNKIPLLAEIEKTIAEVFDHMFEEDRIEYFEEALELLAMFVYHSAVERGEHLRGALEVGAEPHEALLGAPDLPDVAAATALLKVNPQALRAMQQDAVTGGGVISPYLWSLFPRAMHAFHDWASDYSCHYLHLVDSYISKSPRVFMSSRDGETSFVQLLLGMISRLWDDCSLEEEDFAVQGGSVCGLFLQHCRNLEGVSIDREVGVLTQLAVLRLRVDSQSLTSVSGLIRALAHLTYVSPVTTLTVIDKSLGCTEEVFSIWMEVVRKDQLEKVYDRKASAIAFSAILGSDWSSLPVVLRQSIPQLLVMIVKLLESLADSSDRVRLRNGNVESGGQLSSNASTDPYPGGGCGTDFTSRPVPDGDPLQKSSCGIKGGSLDADGGSGADKEMGEAEEQFSHDIEDREEFGEDCGEPYEVDEDGENPMFCILNDVDELLFFESVIRRLPPAASQQLMTALASDDTQRIQCTLHRAAELRTVQVNGVAHG